MPVKWTEPSCRLQRPSVQWTEPSCRLQRPSVYWTEPSCGVLRFLFCGQNLPAIVRDLLSNGQRNKTSFSLSKGQKRVLNANLSLDIYAFQKNTVVGYYYQCSAVFIDGICQYFDVPDIKIVCWFVEQNHFRRMYYDSCEEYFCFLVAT